MSEKDKQKQRIYVKEHRKNKSRNVEENKRKQLVKKC